MPGNPLEPLLEINIPSYGYTTGFSLEEIHLRFLQPGIIALVGPNGSGKSTLLRLTAGLLRSPRVHVAVRGVALQSLSRKAVARVVSWVPQRAEVLFSMTVAEMVRLGRYRWNRPFKAAIAGEEEEVGRAIAEVGLSAMVDRDVDTLSGGEWQRALVARAIAQETPVMLLDEPIAGLDLQYQEEIYLLLQRLAARGRLIIVADHHLEVAASYAERIVMLHQGRIAGDGSVQDVLTTEKVSEVFGVSVRIFSDPVTGSPRLSRPKDRGTKGPE